VIGSYGQRLTCVLKLDGFTYDRFAGVAPTDAAARCRWLARQSREHRIDAFRPQPYEQAAKVLREMGHAADARKIARAGEAPEMPSGSIITVFGITWPAWALRLVYWAQIIGGWVFSGLLVAVLSGVMKKEE
jgi:hypothetical protein